ncbi:hypothetical protein, partial [Escherichia coli]|uniref:hypothetical protein n=1 Tax=Escherichia coli TaxID=562 RepID=UPI001BDB88E3
LQILRCFFAQRSENVRYSQLYINTVVDLLSLQSISHGVGKKTSQNLEQARKTELNVAGKKNAALF